MHQASLLIICVEKNEEYSLQPHGSLYIGVNADTWTTDKHKATGTLLRWNGEQVTSFDGTKCSVKTPLATKILGYTLIMIPHEAISPQSSSWTLTGDIECEISDHETLYVQRVFNQPLAVQHTSLEQSPLRRFNSEIIITCTKETLTIAPLLKDITIEKERASYNIFYADTGARGSISYRRNDNTEQTPLPINNHAIFQEAIAVDAIKRSSA